MTGWNVWKDETERYMPGGDLEAPIEKCAHCGGLVAIRNPRGDCDHLYWPDNLTEEAKRANGYRKRETVVTEWVRD